MDEKLAIIGLELGYAKEWQTWWHKKVPHNIGGLGSSKTSVKGSRMIPCAICGNDGKAHLLHLISEEVQNGKHFLFGLDLQRVCRITVDALNGVIYREHPVTKEKVPLETAQAAGSGLLMFRADRFLEAKDYFKRVLKRGEGAAKKKNIIFPVI